MEPDTGRESRVLPTPPAFDARRSIAMSFGTDKLEWRGYLRLTMKKVKDTFTRFDRIHGRDGQTDRHRMTA